jgi:hypothetical protein
MRKRFDLRSSRKGKRLLPPNPTRWEHEHNALDVRHELGLPHDEPLDPLAAFELLDSVLDVVPHTELSAPAEHERHFSGTRQYRWSGMCIPLPEGDHLVVYNGFHPQTRVRATLMEEFFHLWLGHAPTKIRVHADGAGAREFDSGKESEAYGSGAAALVPYGSLRSMLAGGLNAGAIGRHFNVSEQLVAFRIKVAKLTKLRSSSH